MKTATTGALRFKKTQKKRGPSDAGHYGIVSNYFPLPVSHACTCKSVLRYLTMKGIIMQLLDKLSGRHVRGAGIPMPAPHLNGSPVDNSTSRSLKTMVK